MPQVTEQGGTAAASPSATSLAAHLVTLDETRIDAGRPQGIDPLVSIRAIRFIQQDDLYARYFKRAFDLCLGGVLLMIFAPVILVAGLAVLFTSGAPVFYASPRIRSPGP